MAIGWFLLVSGWFQLVSSDKSHVKASEINFFDHLVLIDCDFMMLGVACQFKGTMAYR